MSAKPLAVGVFAFCENQQTKFLWKHVWLTFGELIKKDLIEKKIIVVMKHGSSDPIAISNTNYVTVQTCIRQTFTKLIQENYLQIRHVRNLSIGLEELNAMSKQCSVQDVGIYINKDCNNSIWIVGPSLIIGRVVKSFENKIDLTKLYGETNCQFEGEQAEIKAYVDLSENDLAIVWIYDLFKLGCFKKGKIEIDPHNCGFKISVPDFNTKILIEKEIRSIIASKNLSVTMKNHVSHSLYQMILLESELPKSKSNVKQGLRKYNCIWFKHNPNTITLYAENHHILEMACCVIREALYKNEIVKKYGSQSTLMDVFIPRGKVTICNMLLKDRKSSIENKYSVNIYGYKSTSIWFNLWSVQGEYSMVHAAHFELLKITHATVQEKTFLVNKPLDSLRLLVKKVADKRSCCVSHVSVTHSSHSELSSQQNNDNPIDLRKEVRCRSITVDNGFTVKLYKCSLSKNYSLGQNTLIVHVVHSSDNSSKIKFTKDLSRPDQTTLYLPNWKKAKEQEYLQKLMAEMKDQSVFLPVSIDLSDVVKLNWPVIKFLGTMLFSFTLNRPTYFQCFVPTEDILEQSSRIVNQWSQLKNGCLKPQYQIKVVKGELTAMTCDVLVNTTNCYLDLTIGKISNALLTAAGNQMQNECNMKLKERRQITRSEVVVTSGYNLQAKHVFHGVIPEYKDNNEQRYETFVKICIKKAVELDMISIAFPAIGTGKLQYPPNIAAFKMFQAVEEVAATTNLKYLKEVNFVIFPTDEHVLQAFKAEEQSRKTSVTIDSVSPAPTLKLFEDSLVASPNFTTCIIEIAGLTDEIVQETFKQIEEVLKGSGNRHEENQRDGSYASKSSYKQRGQDHQGDIQFLQHIWNTMENSTADAFTSRKDVSHLSNPFAFNERPTKVSFLEYMLERPHIRHKTKYETVISDSPNFVSEPNEDSLVQRKINTYNKQKEDMITPKNTNMFSNPNKDVMIAERSTILQNRKEELKTEQRSNIYPKLNDNFAILEVPKISCHLNEEKKIIENDKVLSHPNDDSIIRVRPKILNKQTEDSIVDDNSKFINRPKSTYLLQERTKILHTPKEDSISLVTQEGIKVFVYKANICYLNNIDCIVNLSDSQMKEINCSTNIILEAGDETKKECSQYIKDHGQLDEKCICSTTAGNLSHYRTIYHVNCYAPTWRAIFKETPDFISAVIKICLTQANTDDMSSIALQPIVPVGLFAIWKQSLVGKYPESVMKFSAEVGIRSKVKEIHFVDTDQAVVDCLEVTVLQTLSESHQLIRGNNSGMIIGMPDLKKFHSFNTNPNTMKSIFNELKEEKIDKAVKCQSLQESDRDMNVPSNWTQMDAKEMITTVVLQPNDQEYKDVVDKFKHGSSVKYDIVRVVRIQNKTLYMQYVARKTLMDSINPSGCRNERVLWHGTASEAVDGINTYGFNRSYSGKNAALYGNGVYFAEYPSYSSNSQYAKPDQSSNKRVYLCKVLVGEYVKGERSMRVPPQKPGASASHILYDSVVDNQSSPKIFVIFHDTQAYPDYLIVFK